MISVQKNVFRIGLRDMNKDHKCGSGVIISLSDVLAFEESGLSDAKIAEEFGLTRMGFRAIRRIEGWERVYPSQRSDKGVARVDPEDRKQRWNDYMREYQHKKRNRKHYEERREMSVKIGRPLRAGEVVKDGVLYASRKDYLKFCYDKKLEEAERKLDEKT